MGATRDIIAKAVKDQAFREQLLKNPKSAIQKEFGITFPEGVTVRVHENSPTVINLVLPEPLELSSQRELTPQELQQVAGGTITMATLKCKTGPICGGLPTVQLPK
jgi:hypothetical protein